MSRSKGMLFSFSIWRRASIVSFFPPSPLFEFVYQMSVTDLTQRDHRLAPSVFDHDPVRLDPEQGSLPHLRALYGHAGLHVHLLPDLRLEMAALAQRPLQSGRADLQRVRSLEDILFVQSPAHSAGHPAAQIVCDATHVVDEEAKRLLPLATDFPQDH